MENCPACAQKMPTPAQRNGGFYEVMCKRCGNFAWLRIMAHDNHACPEVSGWIREQNDVGSAPPTITFDNIDEIKRRNMPSFSERANRLIGEAARLGGGWGGSVLTNDEPLIARVYARDEKDLITLCEHNVEQGYFKAFPI